MKNRTLCRFWCVVMLLAVMVLPVRADTGPKPSVNITVEHLDDQPCYVTLLSTVYSTGPHSSVYRPGEDGKRSGEPYGTPSYYGDGSDYGIHLAFRAYEDTDPEGLYFLQTYGQVTDGTYRWGYYPPERFKILLYFPESESFAVTDSLCERYAFHSYYTVDLAGVDLKPGAVTTGLTAVASYDHTWELVSLMARIVITVALELLVAWMFGLRRKGQMLCILLVNLVTQVGLNVALNLHVYYNGSGFLLMCYLMMELAVLAVETMAYRLWLPGEKKTVGAAFRYAFAANLVSFAAGWLIACGMPGIF